MTTGLALALAVAACASGDDCGRFSCNRLGIDPHPADASSSTATLSGAPATLVTGKPTSGTCAATLVGDSIVLAADATEPTWHVAIACAGARPFDVVTTSRDLRILPTGSYVLEIVSYAGASIDLTAALRLVVDEREGDMAPFPKTVTPGFRVALHVEGAVADAEVHLSFVVTDADFHPEENATCVECGK